MRRSSLIVCLLGIFALSGCAGAPKDATPPTIESAPSVSDTVLDRPEPQNHREVDWVVLSTDERAEAIRLLSEAQALMCMTPQGYENLAHNTSEVRRWTRQMIELVQQYEARARQPVEDTQASE